MQAKRIALAVLSCGAPLTLAALLIGGPWADWVFVAATLAFPPSLILLAVSPTASSRVLVAILVVLWLVLELSAMAMLLLARGPATATVLGLPWATAIMLGGLGLLPLVLVVLGYAATFDASGSGGSRKRG
jgi:hypothetical protein